MDKSRATGRAKKMVPRPPPAPYSRHKPPDHFLRNMPASSMDDQRNQMVHMIANLGASLYFLLYFLEVNLVTRIR